MDGTAAARLLDWDAAARMGGALAGPGPKVNASGRARMQIDFAELVARADELVSGLTGLTIDGPPTHSVVLSRADWVAQNLRGFERVIEPFAQKIVAKHRDGVLAPARRKFLAAQVGGLLGYLGRKVLGQYDLLQPTADGRLLYFVGPNVAEMERLHRFGRRDFRLWLCLHEVAHRVQFAGVPWMRPHLDGLIRSYLESVDVDARRLAQAFRRAVEQARATGGPRGLGILALLMTPEQRDLFQRMQALMSLLEGHGNYVMDALSPGNVRDAERMRRVLHQRRKRPLERSFQRAIGLDVKVRQYDQGERFVRRVVERAGNDGFNRVWERPEHLPTLDEITDPDAWVRRVTTAS